jgi:hypothetical protein
LEVKQKRTKLVDASGMAVRVRAENAVSAEEEQQWRVRMESVGHQSSKLERTVVWNGQETVMKTWKKSHRNGESGL